jgi:putative component of toxin-antitoxin plasmid stabilization module
MTSREQRQYDWTFRGFETPVGNRPVRDWINALSEEARDELVDILIYMKFRPHNEWAPEHFKPLEDGISEIRFRDGGSVCRMYGYFGPQWFVQSYTFLVGAEKKVKNDRDSKKLAKSRRDQVERREARVHVFSFQE